MNKVVDMGNYREANSDPPYIKPKIEAHMYAGHRYILRFDPNEVPTRRWLWIVKYTKTYEYVGNAATIEAARRAAIRQIASLNASSFHDE